MHTFQPMRTLHRPHSPQSLRSLDLSRYLFDLSINSPEELIELAALPCFRARNVHLCNMTLASEGTWAALGAVKAETLTVDFTYNNYIDKLPLNLHLLPPSVKRLKLNFVRTFKLVDTEPTEERVEVDSLEVTVGADYLLKWVLARV